MRNAIIALFFVLLFVGPAFGQAPEKLFVGNCSFSGFSLLADSTYRGNITRFDDRMGDGYNLTQLAVGYEIFDGRGLVFTIDTIHTSTNFTADVSVTAKIDRGFEPFGSGQVYQPTANGLIPPSSQEQAGLSPTQKARIDRHNVVVMQSLIGGRDSVYSITNVPDTSSLSPVMGDIFINAAGDTMGVYSTSWVLFFGGGGLTGSGTTGNLARWASSTTLTDADIIDNGTTITVGTSRAEVTVEATDSVLVDGPVVNVGGQPSATIRVSDTDETVTIQAGALEQKIVVDDFGLNVQVDGGSYYMATGSPPVDGKNHVQAWFNGSAQWLNLTDSLAAGGAGVTDGDKGDIDVTSSGTVWTIDTAAVVWNSLAQAVKDSIAAGWAGDNLGDHTATTDLDLDGNNIQMAGGYVIGGTGTGSDLILQSTSGVGAGSDDIIFLTGNNGSDEAMRLKGNGLLGIGTDTPTTGFGVDIGGGVGLRIRGGTTASRPAATSGGHWFNTSDLRPQWSDGVSWYNYSPWTRSGSNISFSGGIVSVNGGYGGYSLDVENDSYIRLKGLSGNVLLRANGAAVTMYDASYNEFAKFSGVASGRNSLVGSTGLSVGNGVPTAAEPHALRVRGNSSTNSFWKLALFENSAATPVLYMQNDGLIGVGTTSPAYILDITGTGGARIPVGTTAQRPTGANAVMRYNSTNAVYEGYSATGWRSFLTTSLSAGKFTSTAIPFSDSDGRLTEDATSFTFDDANDRLGLVDVTPDVTLDMSGATDGITIPTGTTAQRGAAEQGQFRLNNTLHVPEIYDTGWYQFVITGTDRALGDDTNGTWTDTDRGAIVQVSDATDNSTIVTYTLDGTPDDQVEVIVECKTGSVIDADDGCRIVGNGNNIQGSANYDFTTANTTITLRYSSVLGEWKIIQ